MYIKFGIVFFFLGFFIKAQVYPSGGVQLNHIHIMFEYPQFKAADVYKLQIALSNAKTFEKSIVYEAKDSATAHLVDTKIEFGNKYRWRYMAYRGKKIIFTSPEYMFETFYTNLLKDFKVNITKYDSTKSLKGLIFLDYGVVINRKGKLILITDSFGVEKRDFSLTHTGSLTYLMRNRAYDRELGGKVIWYSRNFQNHNDKLYEYHHDVTKLKNGNYLVMCKVNDFATLNFLQKFNEAIIEVDAANNLQWIWKENDHIEDTSIKATHLNSIFLTDDNKIMVSGRDVNSIFTIDRISGKIEKSIGYKFNSKVEHYPQEIFNGQHMAQLLPNGNILLFNNNTAEGRGKVTSILEINNPDKNNKEVVSRFFYFYDFGKPELNLCTKGGGVIKMKNNNYLISSSAYNRNFEITPESEIIWECRPERLDSTGKAWMGMGSYRINYAETLYPSFFTLEWVYVNDKITGYKIVNKGSADDTYEVTLKDIRGIGAAPVFLNVAAGKSITVKLDPSKTNNVIVLPQSNPVRVREIKIQ